MISHLKYLASLFGRIGNSTARPGRISLFFIRQVIFEVLHSGECVACLARAVHAAALLFCGMLVAAHASAQGFPSKPVKIVLPYETGGSVDFLARTVAGHLSSRIGQPVLLAPWLSTAATLCLLGAGSTDCCPGNSHMSDGPV